ncbi:MAG: hypothetical protein ACM3JD_13330 [Rudaea sp.]
MSLKRFLIVVIMLAIVIGAGLTIWTTVTTSAAVARNRDLADYALRHPSMVIASYSPDQADYALRHPELFTRSTSPDLSDYALRHPELFRTNSAAAPPNNPSIRLDSRRASGPDLSDWYLRHRAEVLGTLVNASR